MRLTSLKSWMFGFIAVRVFIEGAEEFFILPTAWYYIKSFGQTKTFLGIVLSAYSISAVLTAPVIGRLADRFRHIKCIILVCYFLKVCGYLIYSIPVSEYFPLVGRFISGVAHGSTGVLYGEIALYTREQHRAKVFIFLDGVYALGGAFGPTISSLVIVNVNIIGWKIGPGNSAGFVLTIVWLISLILALCLPNELGRVETSDEKSRIIQSDNEQDFPIKKDSSDPPRRHFDLVICCVFYLIFLSIFYSATVTFYTPLIALEQFHLRFIHVKLLFLTSSMFAFALFLLLYITAEYFDERRLLVSQMLLQISAIALLAYFTFRWKNISVNESYILIVLICLGAPSFSFSLGCSLLSKITNPEYAAFYQSLSIATVQVAFISGRIISGFISTKTWSLIFCLGLTLSWVVEVLWFFLEYPKLVIRKMET